MTTIMRSDKGFVCTNFSVHIGKAEVVKPCNFAIDFGELAILAGPNGAGKSSLLRGLAGALPHTGEVLLQGRNLRSIGSRQNRHPIAYLPQNGQVYWPMPVRDIVALGQAGLSAPLTQGAANASLIDEAMKRCDVFHLANRISSTLSGGECARVLLARAMATGADILLADEPMASLDARYQLSIMRMLQEYAQDGRVVITVLHDLSLGMRFSSRLLLMNHGSIVADGDAQQMLDTGLLQKVFSVHFQRLSLPNGDFGGIIAAKEARNINSRRS